MLICVSGSSGVGKTTFARLLEAVLGSKNTVCLSGDDLHLWERGDVNWQNYTHLDPKANDLETGYRHIKSLMSNETIERKVYNHDTGKFDPAITISPKENLIYEGLHALWDSRVTSLSSLCVFVDTEESLKTEWKIKRDTKRRGYTQRQVIDAMSRRRFDENDHIVPQRDGADVVVRFNKSKDSTVSLEYLCVTGRGSELMAKVKEFYDSLCEFMVLCKWLSLDVSLVQGRGGNVSVKSDSGLIIKASGSMMGEVNLHHGLCVCDLSGFPILSSDDEYTEFINSKVIMGTQRPSMETGFHSAIPYRTIAHTHPLHLNAILCSREARSVIRGLFSDMSYDFIEYTTPGVELVNRIGHNAQPIIFLENHGLIVGADNAQDAFETTERINNRCKRWLSNHVESIVDLEVDGAYNLPLFPDAAVFPADMVQTNNYILHMIMGSCLTPRFLDDHEVNMLNSMTSEKHRKAIP